MVRAGAARKGGVAGDEPKGAIGMSESPRFFRCRECGGVVTTIRSANMPLSCCGQPMEEIVPAETGAAEKHRPVAEIKGSTVSVSVGAVGHPMLAEHAIEWVYLQTGHGGQWKRLAAGGEPKTVFSLEDDQAVAVFAFCNLHGLWQTTL